MNVGFVVTELLDGRFVPWEKCLEWESYLDLYCLALRERGHTCVKYVPSIGVSRTESYMHKFGHEVKRVPAHNALIAPRGLLRSRSYEGGLTTIFRQMLGPAFTLNLQREARRDGVAILHYSSYYSLFFTPAFLISEMIPFVTQYTGGALPQTEPSRLIWQLSVLPSLKSSNAVLLGDYRSEKRSLVHGLCVPLRKLEFFNAPIVDSRVFHEHDKAEAQSSLGFDQSVRNVLCVSYIPPRHTLELAKDPYLMLDIMKQVCGQRGEEVVLYVAGWGVGFDEFREYIKERGMEEHVHLLGMVDHQKLPVYYSACDLVFLPIRLEKLNEGSVTIEAFACRRPVVAFKRHTTDDEEQQGGFLVEDNVSRGSQGFGVRVRDKGYLEEKGREGILMAQQFTLQTAGKRLEEVYTKVLRF